MNRLVVGGLAMAIGLTFVGGVSTAAASRSSGAKACVNSHHVLALATKKGRCAKGETLTTLGKPGPRGATGKPGSSGSTVLSGSGAPAASLGAPGDFYMDTGSQTVYGPKIRSGWGSGTSLIGPKGDQGPQGPGGQVAAVDSSNGQMIDDVDPPGTDIQVRAACNPNIYTGVYLFSTDSLFIHGTVQTNSASSYIVVRGSSTGADLTSGTNLLGQEASPASPDSVAWSLNPGMNGDYAAFDLVINDGAVSTSPNGGFTLDGFVYQTASRCQAVAAVVPLAG